MIKLSSSRSALLGGVLLTGTAVLLATTGRDHRLDSRKGGAAAHAKPAKSCSKREVTIDAAAALEREIRGMSLRQVRDALPETAEGSAFAFRGAVSRTALLFRRLGELEGEAALDEILARYGRGDFTANAMTQVVLGWMRSDRKAALEAFRQLMGGGSPNVLLAGMSWRGEPLLPVFG